ncbi:SulP family inorganic anion transporter [Nevskia ramosa]|uniref:SulP family inorganic anion transporter n=1 Tax=Nevskia ramosa TaxID=64002 RepID=UPI000490DDCF|nr:SulP family inorganic anion transporter [Nevskia ramosa]
MIAVTEAAKAGLFARRHWLPNLMAGLLVGVVSLPLSMAFAIASGVKPEQGLHTAVIAGLIVALFGGTRNQIAGPTGAFVVILAGVTAQYGVDGLILASFMAGAILIAFGLARLGNVIRFIPSPVVLGFTAGIGLVIFISQWPSYFGLADPGSGHFHERLWRLLQALPNADPVTTMLANGSLLLMLVGPRIPGLSRVPGPLLAMLAATLTQAHFQFDSVITIGKAYGAIPAGLPAFSPPVITATRLVELLPAAFSIALLGALESLLSAVVADKIAGTRHDANQELIAQGAANLVTPLFGGFAASGALARTATSIRNGATGPLAGITHAAMLLAILLFFAPYAANVPLCALAAILFGVSWKMSEMPRLKQMIVTAPRGDIAVLAITFVLTVFADLIVAVNIGVIVAMLLFLRRMASSVAVTREDDGSRAASLSAAGVDPATAVEILSIDGPLFFGAIGTLEQALAPLPAGRSVIFRLHRVPFMDITGIEALADAISSLERRDQRVRLCEANPRVLGKLVRAGLVSRSLPPRYFRTLELALTDSALPHA